ncbi:hypothetical protein J8F10_29730 [Gemmata sp. G18]|uniref:Phage tail protein n=1 Tax=Gemmata palustris TaxID=2822762 RepID=A0ABS5C0N8_9BACT|nr:hypothetical protein [Gemmata palustris]MBP3959445.1 hypothetical protein [Gemmata palustris]
MGALNVDGPTLLGFVRHRMKVRGLPDEVRVVTIEVEGVKLHARTLTAERWAALYQFERQNPGDMIGRMVRVIAFGLCDAEGQALLTIDEARDLPYLTAVAIADQIALVNKLTPLVPTPAQKSK